MFENVKSEKAGLALTLFDGSINRKDKTNLAAQITLTSSFVIKMTKGT